MNVNDALKAWLPDHVRFALRDPRQDYPFWGNEQDTVASAIPKRQTEFSAGRDAARGALRQFGVRPCAIPVVAGRAPLWPTGYCGSISHSDVLCIAIVTGQNRSRALGIDVERAKPLKPELRRAILHETENEVSAEQAIAIFSRKEALFKALFPLTGEWFGFQAARSEGPCSLVLTKKVGAFPIGAIFNVPSLAVADHVISFCDIAVGHT